MKLRLRTHGVRRYSIETLEDRRLLAVTYTIEQLTDNGTFDSQPWVWGDQIAWQGRGGTDEGTDDEIFWYDGATTTQLTENTTPDQYPKLSALGLAWERGTGATKKIIYHDTVGETTLESMPLGNFQNVFTLTDDRLTWEDSREADFEIYTWNDTGDPANLSNNTLTDRYVNGDGNSLVWVEIDGAIRRVRYFDGATTTTIGASIFSIEDPKISGQIVAWEGFKSGATTDREIYYYDGATDHQLTDNAFSDFDPQVSGQNIVWWGGTFNNYQVYLFDGSTIAPLSTGTLNQFPQIDGNRVVWQGSDGNDMEIFYYDGETVTQLTDNDLDDTKPRISGNHIVWQGAIPFNGDSSEIFHTYVFPATTVVGRHIFYNQSTFDGNSAAINASDNNAIAPDKSALLPGAGQAVLANITNYTRGINGIIIDLSADASHSGITANDFIFKVGANNTPSSWAVAPAPSALSVSMGGGVSGADRVTITWADSAIKDTYLEIGILPNGNTNLTAGPFTVDPDGPGVGTAVAVGDVFFFGNLMGETASATPAGSFARSAAADGGAILANGTQFSVGITNTLDINKSNSITVAADRGPILAGGTKFVTRISIGTGGPLAPEGDGDAGIASALAMRGIRIHSEVPRIGSWELTMPTGPTPTILYESRKTATALEAALEAELDESSVGLDTQTEDVIANALATGLRRSLD